jgi:spore maturation protein CgeB
MRWLVLGLCTGDSFAENVSSVLSAAGQEVRSPPVSRYRPVLTKVVTGARSIAERMSSDFPSRWERWAIAQSRQWHPDVVLAPTGQVSQAGLAELRRSGSGALVAWWGDPPTNMRRMGLASPLWDLILFKDEAAVGKYRLLGLNAHLLHEAMNPLWHRPLATCSSGEVAVAGNCYGFRQSLVSALVARGEDIALYGGPPPAWSLPEIRRLHRRRYIVREEKSKVFGQALACLNSFSVGEGNSLNCRAFEIAGAGGLQVIEHRQAIEACFENGREVLSFRTLEELKAQLDRARRFPAEAVRIREAGARRALAEHTYVHRLNEILALLGLGKHSLPTLALRRDDQPC